MIIGMTLPFTIRNLLHRRISQHVSSVIEWREQLLHTNAKRQMYNKQQPVAHRHEIHWHPLARQLYSYHSTKTWGRDTVVDFYEEPVTFFKRQVENDRLFSDNITSTMTHLDSYLLSAISRGKLAKGGGDDQGIAVQAAHSSAIATADLIHSAHDWCYVVEDSGGNTYIRCDAPMVVVSLLAPLLASAGSAYVNALDHEYLSFAFLPKNKGCSKLIPLMNMGFSATRVLGNTNWNDYKPDSSTSLGLFPREIMHLYGLKFLLEDDFNGALAVYLKLLEECPGDALAISLVLDISLSSVNLQAALRAAASVGGYWRERSRRSIIGQTVITGHSLGSSLIAVGLGLGGRFKDAEMLAESSLKSDRDASSGVAAWALSIAYDAEGRVSEGSSLLSGFDGTQLYDECGYLFFNARLGGGGANFVLDRNGANADRTALRFYDNHFDRVLDYSGYHDSESGPRFRIKPESRRKKLARAAGGAAMSLWGNFLSSLTTENKRVEKGDGELQLHQPKPKLTAEDIFTWLPPTHKFLTEATLILFRLTIRGNIGHDDSRWRHLKQAWVQEIRIQDKYRNNKDSLYKFSPSTRIVSCLVLDDVNTDSYQCHGLSSKMQKVSHLVGCATKIKQSSLHMNETEVWNSICAILSDIRTGYDRMDGTHLSHDHSWPYTDLRHFWEQVVFHAAMKTKTHDALCMARSVFSEGITLRPNSPDAWLGYSAILEELGDDVASEEARSAAVSLGSGEGGRL